MLLPARVLFRKKTQVVKVGGKRLVQLLKMSLSTLNLDNSFVDEGNRS